MSLFSCAVLLYCAPQRALVNNSRQPRRNGSNNQFKFQVKAHTNFQSRLIIVLEKLHADQLQFLPLLSLSDNPAL